MKQLKQAAVSKIIIERPHKKCRVTIHSARPGVAIRKKGADIEKPRKSVAKLTHSDVVINIVEIRKPELDAQLVAESISQQLERRIAFRRAMSGARIGHAAGRRRHRSCSPSRAPKSRAWSGTAKAACRLTLRADVDDGDATAFTDYGTCGIKVWIFKGEILEHDPMAQDEELAKGIEGRPRRETAA